MTSRVLYLLTDEISAVLVRGQLGFLVSAGFDVSVGCRLATPGRPGDGAWDDGVCVEHLPFEREIAPIADARALWATWRLVRRVRPDAVHASTPKAGLLGMLAAWCARVPRRLYLVRGSRYETAVGWRRRLLVGLDRLASACATDVVFNSASLLAAAEDAGAVRRGRGVVFGAGSGNGVDVDRFDPGRLPTVAEARAELGVPAGDAVVVGFVGRLVADKGITDLVAAVEAVRREHDVHLLLVGSFEDGDPVDAATRERIESAGHVTVVPWSDDTGVAYAAMDVLAYPSYREGLPNVPLEAQACEVPVVGYAAVGTVDAVVGGEGGVLVPVGDSDALAAAIGALAADWERRADMGRRGRASVVERFDRRSIWRAVATALGGGGTR